MDILRHTPKDAKDWITGATIAVTAVGSTIGVGISAQRNQEPYPSLTVEQIEQSDRYARLEPVCKPGGNVDLTLHTKGFSQASPVVLTIFNPKTGDTVTAGYFTPQKPMPEEIPFETVVLENQPNTNKDSKNIKMLKLRPDMPLTVRLQESLPNGMFIADEDLKTEEVPKQGKEVFSLNLPQLCP